MAEDWWEGKYIGKNIKIERYEIDSNGWLEVGKA